MVEVLDHVMKLVPVEYSFHFYPGVGYASIVFYGDTANVEEAVKKGKAHLQSMNLYITSTMILNPDNDMIKNFGFTSPNSPKNKVIDKPDKKQKKISKTKKNNNAVSKILPKVSNETKKSEPEIITPETDAIKSDSHEQRPNNKMPPNCNYICSLCDEPDCPERWK